MFTTQFQTIEAQRQYILAQIEKLTYQEQVLVQESLQYQQLAEEATNLLNAVTALKNKFDGHENATNDLFAEISKLFKTETTITHSDETHNQITTVEAVTPVVQSVEVCDQVTAVEAEPVPEETQEVVANTNADSELPILKEITEQEARASIVFQQEQPYVLAIGHLVGTPHGNYGHITDIRYDTKNGGRIARVALPNNGVDEFSVNNLKYIGIYQPLVTEASAPTADVEKPPTKKKSTKKEKTVDVEKEIIGKPWVDIREIIKADPSLLRKAAAACRLKTQTAWVEKLPKDIADYILNSGDNDDMQSLPDTVRQHVQSLLNNTQSKVA